MLTLPEFLRTTPAGSLQAYFAHRGITLPDDMPWQGPGRGLGTALLAAVDALPDADRLRVLDDAQRVGALADAPGQAALYAVAPESPEEMLDRLENGYARSLWALLEAPALFESAEQVRYADTRRYGRSWSGYVAQSGCTVARSDEALTAFRRAVGEQLRSRHVEVEICDRSRATLTDDVRLIQLTIYREGRPETRKTFVNGQVDRVPDRPVIEAALTYEPKEGAIEVVAPDRDTREPLVRLFAEHLLGAPITGERVKLRQFKLDRLKSQYNFPTDLEDNIEEVRLNLLRLMPIETGAERIILECQREAQRSLWQMAAERFGEHDPLADGYTVTQARLTVRFRPTPGGRGRRTLPVTITMPQGCDLKSRSERERLVGEKYLPRWGLVRSL